MRRISSAFLISAALLFSSAALGDTLAWDVTGQNTFGTLDHNTGNFNQVANFGFTPAGIGEVNGVLYTSLSGGTQLYQVNPVNGALSFIGDLSNGTFTYYTLGSTNSALYMVDNMGTLWTINPKTGTPSMVGSTRLNLTNVQAITLSAGSNTLYLTLNNNIYTINTTTGLASYVGTSGSTDFGALIDLGGKVYANTIVYPNSVYMFNPVTGVSSFVTLSNAGDYSWGLAPIVPEPGSFGMLMVAAAALGAFFWKRRRAFVTE